MGGRAGLTVTVQPPAAGEASADVWPPPGAQTLSLSPPPSSLSLFTLERKNFPNANFPLEGSGSFAAALGSSLVVVFAGLADASPLASILGGSGGGGGGTDMPLGAAGGSDTWATYSRERRPDSFNTFKFNIGHKVKWFSVQNKAFADKKKRKI